MPHAAKRRRLSPQPDLSDGADSETSFASFGKDVGDEERLSGRFKADAANLGDPEASGAEVDMTGDRGQGTQREGSIDHAQSDLEGRNPDDEADDNDDPARVNATTATRAAHTMSKAGSVSRMSNGHGKTAWATARPPIARPSTVANSTALFQIQIDDLLNTVRPRKTARNKAVEACLHDLKGIFQGLPERPAQDVLSAEREMIKKHRITVPFPDPRPPHDAQYKLAFQPPSSVNVVGSYAQGTGIEAEVCVDMLVQLPDSLFQDKDYRDHRYHYRRAYWLACLAVGVVGKYAVRYDSHGGSPLAPVLVVQPLDKTGKDTKWRINVLPAISENVFSDERLLPGRINVKSSEPANNSETFSNAFYNSSLQAERKRVAYLKLIHAASVSSESFKDACILLKIWLRQRGLSSCIQHGGFGGFEASAVLAVLVTNGTVSPRYTSLQLMKAALQFLATRDPSKASVSLGKGSSPPSLSGWPVLFDHDRSHNLAYKMTPWSTRSLSSNARATLSLLGNPSLDNFDATFILRENILHHKHDLNLAVPSQLIAKKDVTDHEVSLLVNPLREALHRGLGDRITALAFTTDRSASWDLGSARPSWSTKGEVIVSIDFNATNAGRTVDHGPSAEDKPAAEAFRKFWGDKAELRRFKDGRILESLVWNAKGDTQSLMVDIVTFIIQRHVGSAASAAMTVLGGNIARSVTQPDSLSSFESATEAFKRLESDVRALNELPLAIRQISPSDEHLRFASIRPPTSTSHPSDIVVQFESSTRWPEDLHAVQRVKAAFLLKLSELLSSSHADVTTRVGLENDSAKTTNQTFLDVSYPSTAAATFRIRIHHEREQSLITKVLKSPDSFPADRDAATAALAHYKRVFVATPQHTAALIKLATRHPALSGTVRLLKHWFASHLLSSHFPSAMIETFACRTFLDSAPYTTPPSSVKTGLLRTLAWLARWDWRAEPLLVAMPDDNDDNSNGADTGGSTTAGFAQTAQTRFAAWRKLDPAMVRVGMFVASSFADRDGAVWSDTLGGVGPRVVAASRLTALARMASEALRGGDGGSSSSSSEWDLDLRRLFVADLDAYDFLLRLENQDEQRKTKNKKTARGQGQQVFRNLQIDAERGRDPSFDPVGMFVAELQALFGSAMVLFYGGPTTSVVAGLWNPAASRPRSWKVGLEYSTVPRAEEDDGEHVQVVVNKRAILAEIAALGGELISRIDVHEPDS